MAGAKLTAGNARIQDLSDVNRPQKLAEKYSELYDNEWTDALEEIQDNTDLDEKAAVLQLLELFQVSVPALLYLVFDKNLISTNNVWYCSRAISRFPKRAQCADRQAFWELP